MPSPTPTRGVRRALGTCLLVAALAGCSAAPIAEPPAARAVLRPSTQPVTFAVVGDSITAWTDADNPSWIASAAARRVLFAGGWAVPGATTSDMLEGLDDVPTADVLVIMAGTNDFLPEFPDWELGDSLGRIRAIVDEVGIGRVVLSAIAPNDHRRESTESFNAALRELAIEQDWTWADPWPPARAPDGRFAPGASLDGIHPTQDVEARVGGELRSAVVLAALAP